MNSILGRFSHLRRGESFNEKWSEQSPRGRDWEDLYRDRWRYDKVVRSTHGVNCTGSCSWKIHVKNGIIAFETQQTDYPSLGADVPEYEPRGCPRGASFSWYEYSPLRVKYPYIRSELIAFWRERRAAGRDPVAAWEDLIADESASKSYRAARGKGGFVRATWDEATEMIAAASIHTITEYGPDRIVGFSPIPAMSQVSYAGGSRFLSLIGGTILSFYDWYADLPPASPQIWGDQTDVPESADWYNASYFIIWGTNLPMTRTPDAHFMVEARYNGTKVVGVSPDYAEYIKFADLWLPAKAGTDAALAMAMTHVILQEFYADRQATYFMEYATKFTDLPFLVNLESRSDQFVAGSFLRATDLGATGEAAEWQTLLWDERTNQPVAPNGSLGFRHHDPAHWNLLMQDATGRPVSPLLTFLHQSDEVVMVQFPCFAEDGSRILTRGVPVKRITDGAGKEHVVATVLDLMMAHVGVARGLPGDYPENYDDPMPYTPAWQEAITGVPRAHAIQVAREFADNAERTRGRSMIALGAGTNHWYHSDTIYRSIINLVLLTGCQGVNGGGWAHYVGQEKVRPLEGWSTVAFASDWVRPSRQQNATSFFYFATDQFRYEELETATMGSPLGGRHQHMHPADFNVMAARLGWLPSFPQFTENSLDVAKEARASGAQTPAEIAQHVAQRLQTEDLHFAIADPDNPRNFPRVFFVWRSNLLGASGKGHEYFLKHLLGADGHVLAEPRTDWQPEQVLNTDEVPRGKVDLLVDIDFRMTGTGLYSDIVLPAATWYEKHDLSTTDMHPFLHPFNPAISPPWETRSDWAAFRSIAETFSKLAATHLPKQEDLMMAPLSHDTADELAQPRGRVLDWKMGETAAIPGKTMPKLLMVERDYPHIFEQMTSMGPLAEKSYGAKGIQIAGTHAYKELRQRVGTWTEEGVRSGRPKLYHELDVIETILTLSGASNGQRCAEEWEALGKATGLDLSEVSAGMKDVSYSFSDLTAQPRLSLATPVWSGLEGEGRRYSPFTSNVEYGIPWHTLTGRQHFYVDHEVMIEFGEGFPLYRPPLGVMPFAITDVGIADTGARTVMVRYLTPHQKWGIHSTYADNERMLTLFRGGQTIWMNEEDGKHIGIKDNDWVEVYNRNGAIVARAVLSYRLPMGIAMMYHAQDRTIGVPGSAITKDRGGTHNSVTRIIPKPTHMIGGYAQLSYGFNYYGPTGHQRDVMTVIRPLKEVDWLED